MASLQILLHLLFISAAAASASISPSVQPPIPHAAVPLHEATNHVDLLAPLLANLGYQELAIAVSSLYSPILSAWSGPVTIFAPSDDSVRSCGGGACSPLRLLREHLSPGLFSAAYLSRIPFGTKIETASPGRCLTLTSTNGHSNRSDAVKMFVDGVEITLPDLFNDGRIVIHGLQGFVAPLSRLSCTPTASPATAVSGPAILHLMLRDAIVRLRDSGYGILALAMRVKYAELAALHNMTIFALDDPSIFAGGHSYVTSVRFHVVPNRLLLHADLAALPEGTVLRTLVHGQNLVVTHSGVGRAADVMPEIGLRINYVPIKVPDIVCNTRIAIHGIVLPFPHLYIAEKPADDELFKLRTDGKDTCRGSDAAASGCTKGAAPANTDASATVDFMDDGL